MIRFVLFQALVLIPFISATLLKIHFSDPSDFSKRIVKLNIVLLEPVIVLWTIWGLTLNPSHAVLPLFGLIMVISGFIFGTVTSAPAGFKNGSKKVYVISSSLSNHGYTMGGLICFLFFGERGLGLASIFIIYFMFYTYIFIFSYARYKGGDVESIYGFLKRYVFTLQNLPAAAAAAGLALNYSGVPRPAGMPPFQNLIFITVPFYYFSLGLTFRFREIFFGGRAHIFFTINKFIAVPLAVYLACGLFGISGEVRQVIVIESFMPAAIYSIVTAVLFDLDVKLAGSLFVVNSIIFLALVLPMLFIINGFL